MGVIIFNSSNEEEHLSCNWWNWRPTVELMRSTALLNEEEFDLLSNGYGEFSKEQCTVLIEFFESQVLSDAEDHARFLLSGEKTLEADDFVFHKQDVEKNYSATAVWLRSFVEFLKKSDGISVS